MFCDAWLRRGESLPMLCDDLLKERIRRNLASFDLRRAAPGVHRVAAVAVAIVEEGEGARLEGVTAPDGWSRDAALLLTRRARGLRNHPNQWALPGGRVDAGESAEQAALRELAEEVDLRLEASAVLGRLDDFVTRSGFVITPVVVWAGVAEALTPNADEVASIHRIPVREFMRSDAPWLDREVDGEEPVLRMPVGASWIAAPTAAVLYQFRELCIAGRPTRVAHFEQPLFARR
jgi:8-oxo-dGTP pyrophosphatase MutT (NUDIX family)